MARLLYRLRGVPEEEADGIRELLDKHHIGFYETPVDRWGVSMPAIWIQDENQIDEAKQLLETYHQQVLEEQRHNHVQSETLLGRWLNKPITTLAYIALIAFVLYLVISPFITFLQTS